MLGKCHHPFHTLQPSLVSVPPNLDNLRMTAVCGIQISRIHCAAQRHYLLLHRIRNITCLESLEKGLNAQATVLLFLHVAVLR